jgi:hypothetical protein
VLDASPGPLERFVECNPPSADRGGTGVERASGCVS